MNSKKEIFKGKKQRRNIILINWEEKKCREIETEEKETYIDEFIKKEEGGKTHRIYPEQTKVDFRMGDAHESSRRVGAFMSQRSREAAQGKAGREKRSKGNV